MFQVSDLSVDSGVVIEDGLSHISSPLEELEFKLLHLSPDSLTPEDSVSVSPEYENYRFGEINGDSEHQQRVLQFLPPPQQFCDQTSESPKEASGDSYGPAVYDSDSDRIVFQTQDQEEEFSLNQSEEGEDLSIILTTQNPNRINVGTLKKNKVQ